YRQGRSAANSPNVNTFSRRGSFRGFVKNQSAADYEPPFPLTAGQAALWYIHKLAHGDDGAYNVALAVTLCSQLDMAAFRNALGCLIKRHPMLRASFVFDGERPLQRVRRASVVDLEVRDVSGVDDGTLRSTLVAALNQPFQLESSAFRTHVFH